MYYYTKLHTRAPFMNRLILTALTLISLNSLALAAPSKGENTLNQAKKTVDSYQQLRDTCAKAQGKARQDCLSQLASSSDTYRAAKDLLASTASLNRTRRR